MGHCRQPSVQAGGDACLLAGARGRPPGGSCPFAAPGRARGGGIAFCSPTPGPRGGLRIPGTSARWGATAGSNILWEAAPRLCAARALHTCPQWYLFVIFLINALSSASARNFLA